MKKIIITDGEAEFFNSFEGMLKLAKGYVGFTPDNHKNRYMLVKTGDARGLAVNPEGTWSSVEGQQKAVGDYYLFDSKIELLEWMQYSK